MKCEACDKPASNVYGDQMNLCSSCLDQHEIQKAYDDRMMEIVTLANSGDCESALRILQELLDSYGSRDHKGSFRYGILSHQALVLEQQGRLAEALEKLRSIAAFPNQSEFLVHQVSLFDVLAAMGNPHEANRELERGLDAASGVTIPTALMALARYARVAQRESVPVPVHYRALFKEVIDWWGIDVPDNLLNDPVSLGPAILRAHDLHRNAALEFQELEHELWSQRRGRGGELIAEDRLREFSTRSPVGFCRNKAAEALQACQQNSRKNSIAESDPAP